MRTEKQEDTHGKLGVPGLPYTVLHGILLVGMDF